jgi:hypothetical protein
MARTSARTVMKAVRALFCERAKPFLVGRGSRNVHQTFEAHLDFLVHAMRYLAAVAEPWPSVCHHPTQRRTSDHL